MIYFGEIIFTSANVASPTLCTVVLGAIQIFGTLASGIIVDRLGRKILLLVSGVVMVVAHIALGYYFWLQEGKKDTSTIGWLPLISLVAYIFGYAIGFGPLQWVMLGELIGSEIKRFAFGIACAACLICQTFVIFYFQILIEWTSASTTFWSFSVACILATAFTILLPETKNKSLQQIQDELAGKKFGNSDGARHVHF